MFLHLELVVLILAMTLDGKVYTEEIIGGHEAVPHSRPYMVLLEKKTGKVTSYCGGFLLSEDFVMTAAHCQARSYRVFLGLHSYKNRIQVSFVEKAFPHEDYSNKEYENDIMLLKLSSKAHFNKRMKPISLADQGDGSQPKSCVVSGWGRSKIDNLQMTDSLMEVNVTLIDDEKCKEKNSYCSRGEIGPAEGDSGGPLVCEDGKAYGVVSKSIKFQNGSQFYYYTEIPKYRNWIDRIVTQHGKV